MPKANGGTIQRLRTEGVKIYDNSMLNAWTHCPKMFSYLHVHGLRPANPDTAYALRFGLGVHSALERWFKDKDDQAGIQAFVDYFSPYEEPIQISHKTGKELGSTYSRIFGCSLLTAYFNKYRNDIRRVVELEVPIAEEVTDGVFLAGRVDKIVEGPLGLVYADYKTTKYIDKYRTNPHGQFMTYKWLAERLTGERVSGEVDLLGVSKTKDVDQLLRREPFDFPDYQMKRWAESIRTLVGHIETCYETGEWPRSWKCDPFFRPCAYIPLCTAIDDETRQRVVDSRYVVEYWDPFSLPTQ